MHDKKNLGIVLNWVTTIQNKESNFDIQLALLYCE